MTRFMKTTAIAAALSAATVTTALAEVPLGDVIVNSRIDSVEGEASDKFFPNIATDIENAIEARLPTTGRDTDAVIEVQVVKLFMDGDTTKPDSEEYNRIWFNVLYSHPDHVFPARIDPVVVSAVEGTFIAPAGFEVVDPDVSDFYKALVVGTADRVVEMMPEDIDATPVY